jgi:CheY-like chemotaxis protein/DNA-binding CsgD family transcriptional regulator
MPPDTASDSASDSALDTTPPQLAHAAGEVVLIVDDLPDNLALLHDALDAAGYTVLVATDGPGAIARARQARPAIVLLDALMPGMDGFEVARRLKADPLTAAIPIVFMTALTETEHVVAAFGAGGVDYVTKPLQPREVLARMAVHTQAARLQRQARNALDAFGHATLVVRAGDGRLLWQTALARSLLRDYFGSEGSAAPVPLIDWLRRQAAAVAAGQPPEPLVVARGGRRLTFALHAMTGEQAERAAGTDAGDGVPDLDEAEWLIVGSEADDAAVLESLMTQFRLTAREAEVLYWVAKGKTNRDVGDILGSSRHTVTKHMEHILPKLGVETRTAAAALVLARVPGFGSSRG